MSLHSASARASLLLAALSFFPAFTLRAQHVHETIILSSARLNEAVHAASGSEEPTTVTVLEQRDDHASILVHRAESGEPELHEAFDDIYFVQDGRATLVYGGTLEGERAVEPGELRGGTIHDALRQPLAAGDVVVVPADVPHQIEVEPGSSILYHVLKVRRAK